MIKILLWAPFGAGTHYWGPGTSAYRLYSTNKNPHIQVTLIHASEKQGMFPDVFYEQIKLPTLENTGMIGKIRYWLAAKKWIFENYHKYDVVHGITAFEHTFRPMMEFVKYGLPVFIKITGTHGGFGSNSILSRVLGLSMKRIKQANNITGYIAISSMIKQNLLRYGIQETKIFEIPNGVDTNRFKPVSVQEKKRLRNLHGIAEKFTFVYIGGLTHNKRIIEVVKAIGILKKNYPDEFQFLIVGPDRSSGAVEKEIESLTQSLSLEGTIIRIQQTVTPEKYLQISDAFILVSRYEGMSNALLEAMACGLPAVVTNISGSQDLIENSFNGIYTTGTINDIGNKLEYSILNPNQLAIFGSRSRRKIINNFTNKCILNEYISLFKHAINYIK